MNERDSNHREAYVGGVLVWGAAHVGVHLEGNAWV